MPEARQTLPAATQAALWVLSNGTCYAPGCSFPVIHEVRPGIYKKNAQIAHIHGVKGPRADPRLTTEQRESFSNLMLLCLAHHSEIDDKNYGESRYPAELLRTWKATHEGKDRDALSALRVPDEDQLFAYLEHIFEPPLKRLEEIAKQLETTGTINAKSVAELQQVIRVITTSEVGVNARTASKLANAADILSTMHLERTVNRLAEAADLIANSPRFG